MLKKGKTVMKKEDIIKKAEENIAWVMDEGGISREDAIPAASLNIIEMYFCDELIKEDMKDALEYLNTLNQFDLDAIDKEKIKRKRRKELRSKKKKQ